MKRRHRKMAGPTLHAISAPSTACACLHACGAHLRDAGADDAIKCTKSLVVQPVQHVGEVHVFNFSQGGLAHMKSPPQPCFALDVRIIPNLTLMLHLPPNAASAVWDSDQTQQRVQGDPDPSGCPRPANLLSKGSFMSHFPPHTVPWSQSQAPEGTMCAQCLGTSVNA